jgi:SAM-dependent methyltransferase
VESTVRLDTHPEALAIQYEAAREGKVSPHTPAARLSPSIWQYDYLLLSKLSADVHALIAHTEPGLALDLGCGRSPYAQPMAAAGHTVRTLDVTAESEPDYVGTAEETGLPDASIDLVVCTQVLEHCTEPWTAVRELARIVRPGGYALVSVPHVWFYHPHPSDNWRFTQEGILRLLRASGFEVQHLLAQGGSVVAAAQVLNFLAYGAVGKLGAPLYAVLNLLAPIVDRRTRNSLFCLNFAVLARREASHAERFGGARPQA